MLRTPSLPDMFFVMQSIGRSERVGEGRRESLATKDASIYITELGERDRKGRIEDLGIWENGEVPM